jgi:chemotaxis signal transduction protein
MADPALLLGGAWWRLPAGTLALAAPPLRRPLPGGGALALAEGRLVPALDPAALDVGATWVLLPGPDGVLLAAEAFLPSAPPDTPALPAEFLRAPPPTPAPRLAALPATAPVRRANAAQVGLSGLALHLGGVSLTVPASLAEHILPAAPAVPVPAAPPGVLGYVLAGGAPALVLDLGWCAGQPGEPMPADLLAVLIHRGLRFALPCARVAAVAESGAGFLAWLDTPAARRALAEAPAAVPALLPPLEPQRGLLLCIAAGRRFAVPAEEITAVIPPQRPLPPPAQAGTRVRGLCAHRGDVLPVFDAGEGMGGLPALADGAAPLLRLPGNPLLGIAGLAIAVHAVLGLRRVAASACTAVEDPGGLVAAIARFEDAPLPVLRLGVLAAGGLAAPAAGGLAAFAADGPR